MTQEIKTSTTKKQLLGLNGLRALAAIGIVLYHLNQHRITAGLSGWNWNLYKLTELLPFIVSFFFIIGGALHSMPFWRIIFGRTKNDTTPISELLPNVKKSLIDRFFRIAPAYYVALLGTFLVVWILQGVSGLDFLRLGVGFSFLTWLHPLTFFPVEINGPLWFISYDIIGGLLVLAVMHMLTRIPRTTEKLGHIIKISLAYIGIFAALILGHFWFTNLPFPKLPGIVSEWFPLYNPFIFGIHFMFGTIIGALWTRSEVKNEQGSIWYDVLFILASFGLFAFLWQIRFADIFEISYPKSPYHFPFTTLFLAVGIFALPLGKIFGSLFDNKVTNWFARISYSLYLWHAIIIVLLCRWIFGNAALDDIAWWSLLGTTFAISIPLAMFSEKYIERGAMAWKKKNLG